MDVALAHYLGGQVSALSPREQRGMERGLERRLTATYGHGRVVAGELACIFAHGKQIMNGAASLDDTRRMLASSEEANLLMGMVEVRTTHAAMDVVERNYRLV